jgi:uncharacterized protein
MLTDDMIRVIRTQRLGFVATVRPDGTPSVSPKGTLDVLDAATLAFVDLASPGTVANLAANPAVEVNVVDPVARRGYRFAGRGETVTEGLRFEAAAALYADRGYPVPVERIVLIHVAQAGPLWSPAYDWGETEESLTAAYWARLRERYRHLDAG